MKFSEVYIPKRSISKTWIGMLILEHFQFVREYRLVFFFVSLESRRTPYSIQFKLCWCKLMHNRDWTFSFLVYLRVVYLTILQVAQNVTLSDNIMNWKGLEGNVCGPINELCCHLPGKLSKTWRTSTSMSCAWILIRKVQSANYTHIFFSYVYGTVHHLYSCVKRKKEKRKNQLDATYFIIYSILIHCSTCFGR